MLRVYFELPNKYGFFGVKESSTSTPTTLATRSYYSRKDKKAMDDGLKTCGCIKNKNLHATC